MPIQFAYTVDYIHQVNNTTLDIYPRGVKPNPPVSNNSNIKKPEPVKKIKGGSQCGITCLAMLANYWISYYNEYSLPLGNPKVTLFNSLNLVGLYETYDNAFKYYETFDSNFEKIADYDKILKPLLRFKGVERPSPQPSRFLYQFDDRKSESYLLNILDTCGPVIVRTKLTKDGHFILLIGYNEETDSYLVHDPYHIYDFEKQEYMYNNTQGKEVLYPSKGLNGKPGLYAKMTQGLNGVRMFYMKELL